MGYHIPDMPCKLTALYDGVNAITLDISHPSTVHAARVANLIQLHPHCQHPP